MRRTKVQAAETRRIILREAERLFLEQDYETVTLEEIAAAAGVTRGALYWHFGSKNGLLLAIRDEMRAPLKELAAQVSDNAALVPLDALAELLFGVLRRLDANPRERVLFRLLMQLDLADSEKAGSVFQEDLGAAFTQILEVAQKQGDLPPPWTPASAALLITSLMQGIINQWALGVTSFSIVPDAEGVMRNVLESWRRPSKN